MLIRSEGEGLPCQGSGLQLWLHCPNSSDSVGFRINKSQDRCGPEEMRRGFEAIEELRLVFRELKNQDSRLERVVFKKSKQ